MALKLIKPGPVVVSGTNGSYAPASGSAPPGWTVWGSDGRVMPPPGVYRVSHTGMTVRKRTASGRFIPLEGDLVTIESGEAIAADYRNDGDVLMVELIPPPCFVGFVGGGRGGAEARATRPRCIPGAGRQSHRRHSCDVDSVANGTNLPAGGHLLGGDHTRRESREARLRDGECHPAHARFVQGRRLPAAAIQAGRASNQTRTRLVQGVSA